MDGAAPALASAVENATGLFPSQIPVTGERLEELERTDGSSRQEDSEYEN
jgi:CO/xanthine dehydrogenase Mo-binding subunit